MEQYIPSDDGMQGEGTRIGAREKEGGREEERIRDKRGEEAN